MGVIGIGTGDIGTFLVAWSSGVQSTEKVPGRETVNSIHVANKEDFPFGGNVCAEELVYPR
jgi:hypothetical protein